ncbi:hypothetical protein [Blautia sp. MSJ-19]|uniref:hypothetical protein n=1 Tax=Blautia sp. MSJ-19 TaxID=2841517 RepID=UPI001C0EBF60|nr:hypothetical protein [Blautia sp. MSJ-19]MBU5480905.1 hypothetical protein [Blautia sp. MSJ-19]
MDAKEVIERLKGPELPDGLVMINTETRQEAIKALEKQIPKEPIERFTGDEWICAAKSQCFVRINR